ncbi:Gfo/Idh/MocA family oxidoreductase [Schleiferiaceae bacterium]|nr:Gfo/Idh/MocA family oxidoreductase [Schleiferiaceae bacterium]
MKIGVVGGGAIFDFFYKSYLFERKFKVYIKDNNPQRVEYFVNNYGYSEWLGEKVDIALVLVPPAYHSSVILDIENLAEKIIVEKPLVRTHEELESIAHLSDKIFVNNTRRLFPVNGIIKKTINERRVKSISYFEGGKMEWPMQTVEYFTSGRGILEDRGSHVLDLINYWLGANDSIVDFTLNHHDKIDGVEGLINLSLVSSKGVDVNVALNWYEKSSNIYKISFDDGSSLLGEIYDWNTVTYFQGKTNKTYSVKKLNASFTDLVEPLFESVIKGEDMLRMSSISSSIELIEKIYEKI